MNEQLNNLIERAQISDLHSRYFRAIDEKQLDTKIIEATFTTDAQLIKPNSAVSQGQEQILNGHIQSFARFQATQHTTSDFIIEIDNDTASVRANLVAMHVWGDIADNPSLKGNHFHAGGVLMTKAIKTSAGWRISEWSFRNSWRAGEGMQEMAKFARPKE